MAENVLTFQNCSHMNKTSSPAWYSMYSLGRSVLTFQRSPHVSVHSPFCLSISRTSLLSSWRAELNLSMKLVSKCDMVQLQPLNTLSGFGWPNEDGTTSTQSTLMVNKTRATRGYSLLCLNIRQLEREICDINCCDLYMSFSSSSNVKFSKLPRVNRACLLVLCSALL